MFFSVKYREKLQILKESYFGIDAPESSTILTEEGSEYNETTKNDPAMNVYMNAIARHSDSNKMV